MNDALTDWNSPAVIALLLLQFGVLTGLQKINSSVIAQTNELKDRLGTLGPAVTQAEELLRTTTSFTAEFKAVRGELKQLEEKVTTWQRVATEAAAQAAPDKALGEMSERLEALRQEVSAVANTPPAPVPTPVAPPELRQVQEQVNALRQAVTASAQAQATSNTSLRADFNAFANAQTRATQLARDSLAAELRQHEARFRELSEKFLSESAQLREQLEQDQRAPVASPRQVFPEPGLLPKPELDAEMRKEFRLLADRLDRLQRRMEDIIQL